MVLHHKYLEQKTQDLRLCLELPFDSELLCPLPQRLQNGRNVYKAVRLEAGKQHVLRLNGIFCTFHCAQPSVTICCLKYGAFFHRVFSNIEHISKL